MKRYFSFFFFFSMFLCGALILAGCGKKSTSGKFRVGVIAGPEEQLAEVAVKIARERHGVNVELVIFSEYTTPNAALADGSLDANAFQHRPFLERQIADRGYKLVVAGNSFVYPIAGYSRKIKTLAELPDRAQVALPNDPSNLGRALLLLAKQGLITLRTGAGADATTLDIATNPKNLRFVELEAAQLPHALPDVSLAIINTTYASQAGLTPTRDGLFVEDKDSLYVNLIVTQAGRENDPAVRAFVQSYQTEEVWQAAQKLFPDSVVKGW
ncbi:MAG: methionine ABC transporter substrate-binding lipoprotein MetQ [Puniceicoccales bacterium]|jgi:D-methionine transport system substrate-binding protein|nr:methionine ABC transporter substrate-binding lipoprotein MetQ [Puniceicoccales bacterium]